MKWDKKMISIIVAALVGTGGITTVGIVIDRPAMFSELQTVAEQSVENLLAILLWQRADIQKRIWFLQDRIEEVGLTDSRRQRLWELETEYDRLDNAIEELLIGGTEL